MKISAGYLSVALHLQEAAEDLSANDIRTRLCDCINDCYRGTGKYAYYIDHFGDPTSGDVIYSCDGDTFKAPYEITTTGGAAKCMIDQDSAIDVVPRTVYEPEADEDDHYAAMEESLKSEKLYTMLPLYERFIAKSEREKLSADDFAGKGKSFPIAKPEDIMAAVHSMGRAGTGNLGPSGIKARIIAIAKRKGWEKYLPKGWTTADSSTSKEGAKQEVAGLLVLRESAVCTDEIKVQESRATYDIKLIAPGKGAMAYYTPEVLKRDGPKAFPAETKVYLNHPTKAQEAEGPGNRDVTRLAAVTTGAAEWRESHPRGPGLYAPIKVFADHGQAIEEKGKYLAMSIMANGRQVVEAGMKVFREGVPLLAELTRGESVDIVPIAGAGGMILTEAARDAANSEKEAEPMTAEETAKLIEAEVAKATLPLREAQTKVAAREEATRIMESVTLPAPAKKKIVEQAVRGVTGTSLDLDKFRESLTEIAKAEGEYLAEVTGSGRVVGMGVAPVQIDAKEAERRAVAEKRYEADSISVFESLMGDPAAAKLAAKGRAA